MVTVSGSNFIDLDQLTPAVFDPVTFSMLPDGVVTLEWAPTSF